VEKEYSDEQLKKQLNNHSEETEKLLKDVDKMERFLERLEKKLKKIPVIGKQLSNVPMLISLVRAYIHKDYQDIPIGSIIAIVGSLLYFFSQIDLLPDSIPFLGYIDDAAVFAFVWKMVDDDVKEYKIWQEQNGKRIIKD
jgi:uncharacterized membrane protein YkvA (DUF1232 family)